MGSLFNLIQNENMKIYRRLRTWMLVCFMVFIVVLTGILMKAQQTPIATNWKQTLIAQNAQLTQTSKHGGRFFLAGREKQNVLVQIKTNDYAISHNIAPQQTTGWSFANKLEQRAIGPLLTVLVAVIAGDMLAGEFSSGTIKLLLTRQQTRGRILLSKYVAMLLFAVFLIVVTIFVSLVVGGVLFGLNGVSQAFVYLSADGHVQQMGMAEYLFANYGFNAISMLMTVTIAFMISAIFRSSAIAIALSILSLFIGNTLVLVLSGYSWDKYILFANTNLSQYVFNGPVMSGMSLTFSVVVLAVYFVVMNGLSWFIFKKRDVALT